MDGGLIEGDFPLEKARVNRGRFSIVSSIVLPLKEFSIVSSIVLPFKDCEHFFFEREAPKEMHLDSL